MLVRLEETWTKLQKSRETLQNLIHLRILHLQEFTVMVCLDIFYNLGKQENL